MDELICVDALDRAIGSASKERCHKDGILHRAFSIFLVDGTKILLQQRAIGKYHSGGLWTNACCSHPKWGETLDSAVNRRLCEELGINCRCREIAAFVYFHRFNTEVCEYEYDHVFLGRYSSRVIPNPKEMMAIYWVEAAELAQDLLRRPERYTAWFLTAAPMVLREMRECKPPTRPEKKRCSAARRMDETEPAKPETDNDFKTKNADAVAVRL